MRIRHVVDLSLITMNGEVSGAMSTKFRGKRIFNMGCGLPSLKVKLPYSQADQKQGIYPNADLQGEKVVESVI